MLQGCATSMVGLEGVRTRMLELQGSIGLLAHCMWVSNPRGACQLMESVHDTGAGNNAAVRLVNSSVLQS